MTKEDVICMAQKAGFRVNTTESLLEELGRFATFVASAEREACAKLIPPQYFELRDRIRARRQA